MTVTLSALLLALAFVCFVAVGLSVPTRRYSLLGFGLALWVAALLVGSVHVG